MQRLGLALIIVLGSAAYSEGRQDATMRFTVSAVVANVREKPSTDSPVVARLPRGTVVDVTIQRAGWVEVVLSAGGGRRTGFVLGSLGVLEAATSVPQPVNSESGSTDSRPATLPASNRSVSSERAQDPAVPVEKPPSVSPALPASQLQPRALPASGQQPPKARTLGLGGRVGGFSFGVGGSVRLWSKGNLGLQADVSRYSLGSAESFGGVSVDVNYSTLQFGPSVLYTLQNPDPDEDVWIRPYVGGGVNIFRTTLSSRASAFGEVENSSESATNLGFQVLGGAEAMFKRFPRLGVSGDFGYYSTGTPFVGLRIGGLAYGVSVHWYVK